MIEEKYPIKDWKKMPGQMSREEQATISSLYSFVIMGNIASETIKNYFNTTILPKRKIDPSGVKVDYNSATGTFDVYLPRNKEFLKK